MSPYKEPFVEKKSPHLFSLHLLVVSCFPGIPEARRSHHPQQRADTHARRFDS